MRVRGGDGDEAAAVTAPPQHLVFAYYITGHGFGHATRALEVVRHLVAAGHDVHVVTAAPEFVFTTEITSPCLHIRKVLLDCGAVQADALTVDRLASLEKYHQTAVVPRESILRTEVEWLNSIKADLVLGLHLCRVCRSSWTSSSLNRVAVPAFRDVIDVPLVVRRLHKSRFEVRKELGIADDVKVVIFNFGGQPAGWELKKEWLPDGWLCLVCGASNTQELPLNFIKLAKDAYTPDLMAASDCMLGKIGYGTVSEALAYKLPFVFVAAHIIQDTAVGKKYISGLVGNDPRSSEKQPRERAAASVLFDWEEDIYVARAPGRLDVMGGIADYSGSLVLQVSFGSELSNRAPTFDMDLSDFMDGDKPISYDKAKDYFSRDPSQKWAAYVAGIVLVLMTELGVRFTDSMNILVSSSVPEGKGVSSSASVEVATMSAIAAAYGLNISPRDLALLCQKVENRVVGAPCGVMDQMTSACGEANKLLAMVCQPAEVKELVSIPTHIRFWGLDSGIRHSVGGTDYGSVRVGTYMGRKMIKCAASDLLSGSLPSCVPMHSEDINPDEYEEHGVDLLRTEASMEYLCNLPPHRYEAVYAKDIPEIITGDAFLKKYGDHNDAVTVIDPKQSYSVKAPTRHPIYENFRVEAFKALLTAAKTDEQLSALGELMYQCHYSYNACGLGSDGTDRLVNLVQEIQHRKTSRAGVPGLFGAKITGGGSGGSVCVIGKNCLRSSKEIFEVSF
ncbi:hypothetical protein PR202_gb06199 [Eleusine coracana subsp. coracana]|uniref:GHMP kinase N-terminal domain-containing protein n=1 Tax=Eleusine coracana subsp. coracana TaxID=191504 RepID=A0AAV5E9V9_ELECO|nr:hypothetical protein PR202_gb06199 [Eleusine coracana subsp. coracana]